ncbi:eIF2B_5 domain-containing protein [Meloidogyne graminicola]|uniref:Eukaryotic translation initiation factor 2 subunit 2 n=1 Tax=Meloidogyne graminicola TaxID=189291 RepID=A0A8S9ZNM4_9BILA|nr:eIF2B_5 domain-containing protein [Meloidogyne graminicola]
MKYTQSNISGPMTFCNGLMMLQLMSGLSFIINIFQQRDGTWKRVIEWREIDRKKKWNSNYKFSIQNALDLKKKKKSKKKLLLDVDEDLNSSKQSEQPFDLQQQDEPPIEEELTLGPKKKSKRKKEELELLDDKDRTEGEKVSLSVADGVGRINLVDAKHPEEWTDYTYDQLIDMVFNIMREKNPELISGKKKTFVMKPPQVQRAGSKKTAFTNFSEICRLLKREPKHVLQFLMAELGTTGSIDGNQCLIVKGRFQQKHFENVLRVYIRDYVTCHTCRSSDTLLTKDISRLFFIQCKSCGSRCSVSSIKSGFTAMVGKRAAARRAAEATAGNNCLLFCIGRNL